MEVGPDKSRANERYEKPNEVDEGSKIVRNRKTGLKQRNSSLSFDQPETTEDPKKIYYKTTTFSASQQKEVSSETKSAQK